MTEAAGSNDYIATREFRQAEGTEDWPVLSNGATAFFPTASLATAARFVQAIAGLDGIEDHRPSIDLRDEGVTVRLLTTADDWWGMSRRDLDLARRISGLASELGLSADAGTVQSVDPIVVGANDIERIMPFWQALMGYVRRPDSPREDLVDPRGIGPGIWFERVEGPRAGRNRMHVAVWVPPDQADARVAAAIAAGGTVIYERHAPAWRTLTDPEGNEACVSSVVGRD
jgi:4a-hydroxytetrahydrobiopterin dehydratase